MPNQVPDSEIIPFKASGEHPIQLFFGITMVLIFEVGFILLAIFSKKMIGTFVAIGLFLIILFICRRIIWWVHFDKNEIRVKYFYGNEKIIKYETLRKFYKNKEGFTPFYVYVLKFKTGDSERLKKITFHKKDLDFNAFKKMIIELKNE